jgi:hypothetical protein
MEPPPPLSLIFLSHCIKYDIYIKYLYVKETQGLVIPSRRGGEGGEREGGRGREGERERERGRGALLAG